MKKLNRAQGTVLLLVTLILLLAIYRAIILDILEQITPGFQKTHKELVFLKGEDVWIAEQILESTALTTIQRKALEQGYVQMEVVLLY